MSWVLLFKGRFPLQAEKYLVAPLQPCWAVVFKIGSVPHHLLSKLLTVGIELKSVWILLNLSAMSLPPQKYSISGIGIDHG